MFHGKTTPEGDEELRRGGSLTQGSNLYQTLLGTHQKVEFSPGLAGTGWGQQLFPTGPDGSDLVQIPVFRVNFTSAVKVSLVKVVPRGGCKKIPNTPPGITRWTQPDSRSIALNLTDFPVLPAIPVYYNNESLAKTKKDFRDIYKVNPKDWRKHVQVHLKIESARNGIPIVGNSEPHWAVPDWSEVCPNVAPLFSNIDWAISGSREITNLVNKIVMKLPCEEPLTVKSDVIGVGADGNPKSLGERCRSGIPNWKTSSEEFGACKLPRWTQEAGEWRIDGEDVVYERGGGGVAELARRDCATPDPRLPASAQPVAGTYFPFHAESLPDSLCCDMVPE